jgi:signal transduction histidine kinase/ligand-binding sensor domain-containing protein
MSRSRITETLLRLITAGFLLCPNLLAAEQGYEIRSWSLSEGLPHEWVRCFAQTGDGYLWVATRGGLARFDGKTLNSFTRANAPSAFRANENCLSLAVDKVDGSLWIGTREGVVNFNDGTFKLLSWHDARYQNTDVWSLSASRDGGVWAAHGWGLVRVLPDHRLQHFEVPVYSREGANCQALTSVLEDARGRIFIANEEGICVLASDNTWRSITDPSTLDRRYATGLIQSRDGSVYWTTSRGLGRLTGDQLSFFPTPPEVIMPYGLVEDEQGVIWMGGHSGLHQFKDGKFHAFRPDKFGPREGEPAGSGGVEGLMFDKQGNLWVGKRNEEGFFCVRPEPFVKYTKADGLFDEHPWVIQEEPDGRFFVVSRSGVSRWEGDRFVPTLRSHEFFTPAWQTAVHMDELPLGTLTVPGVNLLGDASDFWILRERFVTRARGSNVTVWLSPGIFSVPPPHGLQTLLGSRVTSWRTNGIKDGRLIGILRGADSAIWVGSWDQGLYRFSDDTVTNFNEKSGLRGNTAGPLLCDDEGAIWISNGPGLSRHHKGSFTHIGISEGLNHGTVSAMLDDGAGYYWFATQRAVVRTRKTVLQRAAERAGERVLLENMGPPCFSGSFPAAARSSNGSLWFPTLTGILRFNPKREELSESFPCRIEGVAIDGVALDDTELHRLRKTGAALQVPAGGARIVSIRFNQPNFSSSFHPAYRYRLLGQSSDWSFTHGKEAQYINLPPGRYNFEAEAERVPGERQERANFAFVIAAPYYRTKLFYAASACAFVTLLAALHFAQSRYSRRIYMLEHERAISKERERIAADMHDVLGSSLTKIGLQTELIKQRTSGEKPAEEDLKKLGQTVRDAVSELDEVIWLFTSSETSLADLIEHLQSYAEDFLESSGIRLSVAAPAELPPIVVQAEMRGSIVQIVREALNNAIKHARASHIWFHISVEKENLRLVIRDDGRGVKAAHELGGNGARRGLENMRKRLERLNGVMVVDQFEGTGTRLTVTVPFTSLEKKL